jgi:hypothetical protein
VTNWERRAEHIRLRDETMQILDADLSRATEEIRQRFEALLDRVSAATTAVATRPAPPGGVGAGGAGSVRTPAPEAAFLGRGSVTIVTPLKREAVNARPVVAVEDMIAAQALGDCAGGLGLEVRYDTVALGGQINLGRPGLVVICGPRLSAPVAEVLDQDRQLKFSKAEDGPWTLRDSRNGTTYRSGLDQSPRQHTDVAYLGRLRGPGGDGSVMIFTGIHPQGSLGVARYVASKIGNLYREVGGRLFSMLLRVQFDPGTHEPRHVSRLTPALWQDW